MPAENNVKTLGRVEYIEPNSLFVNSTGDKVQNGIPQPYEDYSFSVNLRVINGNRYDCGMTSDGDDIAKNVLEYASDKGTISFMDGTAMPGQQGYLTTNFTDISMNNPETNTRECLGIESISIKYDSWYYPTVTIKFVDVRGASLMQPAEYEYYNNGGPNLGKNTSTSNSDFFKAFFSFPYPLFKLSVKGFYGKEVTYDLSVLKCNVEFNSATGNFEVVANFIGYMYGMYSDLPFPFVYIAPYINLYGSNTWSEKKGTGDFCYLTTDKDNPIGKPMYTFPELKREVEAATERADKEIEEEPAGKKKVALNDLVKKLETQVIANYPATSKNYSWWSWSKTNTDDNRSGFFYIMLNKSKEADRKIFEDFLRFETYLREYNEMTVDRAEKSQGDDAKYLAGRSVNTKPLFEDVYLDAEEIKKKRSNQANGASAATISSNYTDEEIAGILDGRVVSLCFKKNTTDEKNPVLEFDESSSDFGTRASKSDYDELINEIIDRFKNDDIHAPIQKRLAQKEWTIRAFKLDDINYKNSLVNTLNEMKRELNELLKVLEKLREQKIDDIIKFIPSMRNIYNMVFAHIDTFMSCFYNTLDRIRKSIQSNTDDSRKYQSLCGSDIQVDVNQNTLDSKSSNGGKLPPFTLFYKEETEKDSEDRKVTMIWPGSLNGGDKLDEVKLVEAIIDATSLKRQPDEPVTPKNKTIPREGHLAPISYYDLMHSDRNPYLDVLNEKTLSDGEVVNNIIKVFALRCYYAMLSGSYVAPDEGTSNDGSNTSTANFTKKANLIAELEVGNVERAFTALGMNPTENFVSQLHRTSSDGSSIISEYLRMDKPMFASNGASGNLSYKWIYLSGITSYCLPVGIFTPSVLQNYANGAYSAMGKDYDKFVKITSAGTIGNSFCCEIYAGGSKMRDLISKHGTGDFKNASKLFPNYNTTPKSISGIAPVLDSGNYPTLPSYRKSEAGITNIFMDPLYYSQTSPEARAYLFLMGVPFKKDKSFFLPEKIENGDYPTLLLLREGAVYWRNNFIAYEGEDGAPIQTPENDPITYSYTINNVTTNVLSDVEANDPCLGRRLALEFFNRAPKNASEGRKRALIDYFLKWVDGVSGGKQADEVTDTAYVKVEVPTPSLTFQTIEKNFGLYERGGNINQLLTPASCGLAVSTSATTVNSFANADTLRDVYEVGTDDKLGNLNGKLRTDVKTRNRPRQNESSVSSMMFLNSFRKFYTSTDTIIDFSCLDNPDQNTTVPRNAMNDALSAFVKGLKDSSNISPEKLKENEGVSGSGKPEDKSKEVKYFESDHLKLACYMALKNMYDRWLCSRRRESWYFSCDPNKLTNNGIKSDFTRFFYIDEFYHNIGMQVRPNLTKFAKMACNEGGFTEQSNENNLAARSIMKILSTAAEYGGCALLTLPTMLGLGRTHTEPNNSIAEVFKAYPYNEAARTGGIETSFIVLYSNQKSSVLDIADDKGKVGYKTDGFDIANTWGEIVPQAMFNDGGEDGFVVPCFGVTFAKQNQSYFKDVRLSMEDHQVTEFSIRNEIAISYQNNQGPRETTVLGQDLYAVYSNYSYSCHVSMLGDAQITPLMYFQLNNIAMWKGAYLITNVHHDISARGMETVFSGVRQARPSVPFKNDKLDVPAVDKQPETPKSKPNEPNRTPDGPSSDSERPLDKINVDDVKSIVFTVDRKTLTKKVNDSWINGVFSVLVFYNDGTDSGEKYNNIALTIEATNGLAGKIEDYTPQSSENYSSIPKGRYSKVLVENPPVGEEYRDSNDSFYKFTDGKHMTVSDMRLGFKICEIITGETDYMGVSESKLKGISFGGTSPIMIFGNDNSNKFDQDEIRATYREIFNLVKRMNEAKKPLTFLIKESNAINKNLINE